MINDLDNISKNVSKHFFYNRFDTILTKSIVLYHMFHLIIYYVYNIHTYMYVKIIDPSNLYKTCFMNFKINLDRPVKENFYRI